MGAQNLNFAPKFLRK